MDQNPLRRVSYAVTPYVGKAHMDHTKALGASRLANGFHILARQTPPNR